LKIKVDKKKTEPIIFSESNEGEGTQFVQSPKENDNSSKKAKNFNISNIILDIEESDIKKKDLTFTSKMKKSSRRTVFK
jgi:hypothetical protein